MKAGRKKAGRPKLFEEESQLLHVRLPQSVMREVEDARFALGKQSAAELIRDAVNEYLKRRNAAIADYRRLRERHGGK